jgi:predicted esterase
MMEFFIVRSVFWGFFWSLYFAYQAPANPKPPRVVSRLVVEGFKPASHVGPKDTGHWPKPIVVVLHGNFDRPEWECATWKEVADFYGWILCPRGVRTPSASEGEDRWTYRGPGAVEKEVEAGVRALEARYPGKVSRAGMVLVGFSLGANYAPGLVLRLSGQYPYLFLVEGGLKKLDRPMIRRLQKAGLKGVAMAMSVESRRRMAKNLVPMFRARGIEAVFVDMKGAGHGYREDFVHSGRVGLEKIVRCKNKEEP